MSGRHPPVSQPLMTSGLNVRFRKLQWNIAISDNAIGQFDRGGFALHVSPPMATNRVSAAKYGYSVPVLWYVPESEVLARKQSLWCPTRPRAVFPVASAWEAGVAPYMVV